MPRRHWNGWRRYDHRTALLPTPRRVLDVTLRPSRRVMCTGSGSLPTEPWWLLCRSRIWLWSSVDGAKQWERLDIATVAQPGR